MAGGCLQNLSVPRAAFVGNLGFPFFPTQKSDLFYIYLYLNTPHTLGKAWVTLTVSHGCPRPGMCSQKMLWEFVGVGGCAGSIRAQPGFSFTFWVGVWFGPGSPGMALGGDPWPGLCIGRESFNVSRARDRLWKTSSLARGSAGHPQVPWQGRAWAGMAGDTLVPGPDVPSPLPVLLPGRFPDRCSRGPAPATPSHQHPSSSSSSFQAFPP